MEKKFAILFSVAALALAGCSNDVYLGPESDLGVGNGPIAFSGESGNMSRAEVDASTKFTKFVVEGYKTVGGTNTLVFDDYDVEWDGASSALGTESNTKGWEYVGKGASSDQTIKYWDPSATKYTFVAYVPVTNVTISTGGIYTDLTTTPRVSFTLTGTTNNLQASYVSKVNVTQKAKFATSVGDATHAVKMVFKRRLADVKLGIYETIPGYKVANVKFYNAAGDATPSTAPTVYDAAGTLQFASTYKMAVAYNDLATDGNEPSITFTATSAETTYLQYATDVQYAFDGYTELGTTASDATMTANLAVKPVDAGTALTLKVDFDLVSETGTPAEVIKITGATAVVPAAYTAWQANYNYTYIFKITEKLSGTNPLYPITFDAVVEEEADSDKETITTISSPSITTYQAGTSGKDEYTEGTINVYVEGTDVEISKLYAYEVTAGTATEGTCIKAAFAAGLSYGDVTLSEVTTTALDKSANPAILTVAAGKTYVVVYKPSATESEAVAKVIKVVTAAP